MTDVQTFQDYVKKGDLEAVKRALAADPKLLNETNEAGQSAFLLAKYYRKPAVAEYLMSLRPSLDVFSKCAAGLLDESLEEVDSNPSLLEAHSPDGWRPLHVAAFFGQPELVKGLLNRGAAVDARSTNAMENTPLHAAAAGGSVESAEVLLASGANVNATQRGGWTALHAAAQSGNLELTRMLLAHGADPALRAENNQAALDLALLGGKAEIAQLLEAQGATLQ